VLAAACLSLVDSDSTHAGLCVTSNSPIGRYQEAEGAAIARVIETPVIDRSWKVVNSIGPKDSLAVFSFRLRRVYKGTSVGLEAGDIVHLEYPNLPVPVLGTRVGLLYFGKERGWFPHDADGCSPLIGPEEVRNAAVLDRYASGRNSESFGCSHFGEACWSIKRSGSRIVLRVATFRPIARYRVCVTAPNNSRACRTYPLRRDTGRLRTSRIDWSKQFPDRGHGKYTATWELPVPVVPFNRPTLSSRDRNHVPTLTFLH
jgi:hypothetical protein